MVFSSAAAREHNAAQPPQDPVEIVLRPRTGWIPVDWRELLRYRELLYFLIWRDVKARYKQTVLGVLWAVLQPLFSTLLFTVIFGHFADLKRLLPPQMQGHYAVYVLAGLLPWTLFSSAVSNGGMSLVNQQQLLTKIYFPRLFMPAAAIGSALVDFAISIGLLAALLVFYRVLPSWQVVLLPALLALTVFASLGVGLVLAALTVSYRDFRFVIPFLVQAWQFASPVIYPVNIVPQKWQWLLALNPLTGIIDGFRSALFGLPWNLENFAISSATTLFLLGFGLAYFRRTERTFADVA